MLQRLVAVSMVVWLVASLAPAMAVPVVLVMIVPMRVNLRRVRVRVGVTAAEGND